MRKKSLSKKGKNKLSYLIFIPTAIIEFNEEEKMYIEDQKAFHNFEHSQKLNYSDILIVLF